MNDSDLENAMQCWPGGWPGRQVVDLDNLGDPGSWLHDRMCYFDDALAGDDESVSIAAANLAEDYLCAAVQFSFPIPSDFASSAEECAEDEELQAITEDFCGFLREWRRRLIAEKEGNR